MIYIYFSELVQARKKGSRSVTIYALWTFYPDKCVYNIHGNLNKDIVLWLYVSRLKVWTFWWQTVFSLWKRVFVSRARRRKTERTFNEMFNYSKDELSWPKISVTESFVKNIRTQNLIKERISVKNITKRKPINKSKSKSVNSMVNETSLCLGEKTKREN